MNPFFMATASLIQTLNAFKPLKEAVKEDLYKCLSTRVYKKNVVIQEAGGICPYLFFIEQGLIRHYYVNKNAELTTWFAAEGDFIADSSFMMQRPGYDNLQALEDTQMSCFLYKDYVRMCEKYPVLEQFGRRLISYNYYTLEERFANTILRSASERYDDLLEKHPDIFKRISLSILASYLGVSRETLSRIRQKKKPFSVRKKRTHS